MTTVLGILLLIALNVGYVWLKVWFELPAEVFKRPPYWDYMPRLNTDPMSIREVRRYNRLLCKFYRDCEGPKDQDLFEHLDFLDKVR